MFYILFPKYMYKHQHIYNVNNDCKISMNILPYTGIILCTKKLCLFDFST